MLFLRLNIYISSDIWAGSNRIEALLIEGTGECSAENTISFPSKTMQQAEVTKTFVIELYAESALEECEWLWAFSLCVKGTSNVVEKDDVDEADAEADWSDERAEQIRSESASLSSYAAVNKADMNRNLSIIREGSE